MTVHQAKGLEWPVVFVPALCRNRFPAARVGGVTVWHLIPREAVVDQARYEGTIEDERRLFYVAMTRSQKFLFLTWAPVPGKNNRYVRPSEFWQDVLRSRWVKRRAVDYGERRHIKPQPKAAIANVVFSFSELKYFFECPYQFKLRVLYGFNAPIHEALGYGKSLHDALADINKRALREDYASYGDARSFIEMHMNLPFAYPTLRGQLLTSGQRIVADYIRDNEAQFATFEYSEKNVELDLGDGVSVIGRIDLVRRLDTDETYVVDFKTRERVQAEEVTEDQLSVYALGYERLTGHRPDYLEVYDLDERRRVPRSVDDVLLASTKGKVLRAAEDLRAGHLATTPSTKKCATCDFHRMCASSVVASAPSAPSPPRSQAT
jgi:DNA helicase-2/ATP-dependent DNA helicase PcrA